MRPPIPPRREPPAAPPSAPGQPDRLDALARQLEQQGDLLASAVTTQSQQLVAQQRLLQDVVQGLLFVGAKAGRGGAVAGSAAATACTAAAAPAPASAAAAARPPRPPASRDAQHSADAAALAQLPPGVEDVTVVVRSQPDQQLIVEDHSKRIALDDLSQQELIERGLAFAAGMPDVTRLGLHQGEHQWWLPAVWPLVTDGSIVMADSTFDDVLANEGIDAHT